MITTIDKKTLIDNYKIFCLQNGKEVSFIDYLKSKYRDIEEMNFNTKNRVYIIKHK